MKRPEDNRHADRDGRAGGALDDDPARGRAQEGKRWQALSHVLGEAEIKLDQLLNAKPEIGREVSRVKAELHAQLVRPDYEFWRQERARVLALNEIHPEIGNYLAAIDTVLELEDAHTRAKDRAAPERLSIGCGVGAAGGDGPTTITPSVPEIPTLRSPTAQRMQRDAIKPAGPDFTKPEPEPAGADAEAKSE